MLMAENSPNRIPALQAVKDHNRQFTDFIYVYPVISRRSRGLSIGVNLNPDKICNFDCIYCEVDRKIPGRAARVDLVQLRQELAAMIHLAKSGALGRLPKFAEAPYLTGVIRDIAFSGDGEPTMIHQFAACVQTVVDVKQAAGLTDTKIVLITDAAGLDKADVQRGLRLMDDHQGEIWGKLDAGTESYFRQVNRTTIRFDRILHNLLATARLRPIIIQSLFLRVHGSAMPATELEAYCQRLQELVAQGAQIKEVHAYTVARPTPETFATKLDPTDLDHLAVIIRQRTGLAVEVFP